MRAQIRTVSEERESTGKTMRVSSSPKDLELKVVEFDNGKWVRLSATCRDRIASGWQGGVPNSVRRFLFLDLAKEELEKIIDLAVEGKLIDVIDPASLQGKRRMEELEQALGRREADLSAARQRIQELEAKVHAVVEALREP